MPRLLTPVSSDSSPQGPEVVRRTLGFCGGGALCAPCPHTFIVNEITVLGCGPSLKHSRILGGTLRIGTNDSWKVAWSPIIVTATSCNLKELRTRSGAMLAVGSKPGPEPAGTWRVAPPVRPEKIYFSGVLGYWLATMLRPSRIYLLGFDMEDGPGHFDDRGKEPRVSYLNQRRRLRDLQTVETYIWKEGQYIPFE